MDGLICNPVAVSLFDTLSDRGQTVFTAESCTGGLIAKLLTDIPGSSSVVKGGLVTYTNEMKTDLLGVCPDLIRSYTEVSSQVAGEMAMRARIISKSFLGISTTGFAGPGGGDDLHPVGTVFIGVSVPDRLVVKEFHFVGSRSEIRNSAATEALSLALDLLCRQV